LFGFWQLGVVPLALVEHGDHQHQMDWVRPTRYRLHPRSVQCACDSWPLPERVLGRTIAEAPKPQPLQQCLCERSAGCDRWQRTMEVRPQGPKQPIFRKGHVSRHSQEEVIAAVGKQFAVGSLVRVIAKLPGAFEGFRRLTCPPAAVPADSR